MRYLVTIIAIILLATVAHGQVVYDLAAESSRTDQPIASYSPHLLCMERGGVLGNRNKVTVILVGKRADGECAEDSTGECQRVKVVWWDDVAIARINFVNTGDFSGAQSLWKRLLAQLVSEGKLPAGTIGGTPGVATFTPTLTLTTTPTPTITPTPTS